MVEEQIQQQSNNYSNSSYSYPNQIKDSVHFILNPSAGFLLNWNLNFGMLIIVLFITIFTTVVQKYATDQETLKEIKKEQKEIQKENTEKLMSLFIPTVPNISTGFYCVMPEKDLKRLDLSVEEALKLMLSLGLSGQKEKNEK